MKLRWGFKSETNSIVREIRAELGLRPTDAIDPWQLAEYLAVPVAPMSDLSDDASEAVSYFTQVDRSSFSAVTVFRGSHRMIVQNDSHSPGRQNSNVTHELSHALLQHPPTPAIDEKGCRIWDRMVEDEAEWLSGALLVPEEATLWIVSRRLTTSEAAQLYGVTDKLLDFRIKLTAARKRVSRGNRR